MYNVTIPSIENDDVIKYLKETGQINEWNNDNGRNGGAYTKRPTYRELIEGDKWNKDAIFEWHEQFYDDRGNQVGKSIQKYFSVHAYCRMLHEIYPKKNIIRELQKIQNFAETNLVEEGEDVKEKLKQYTDKHIETPDIFFRNMIKLTFNMYEKIKTEKDLIVKFEGKEMVEKILSKLKNIFTVISKVQPILDKMLQRYPTLIIHVELESALRISTSYEEDGHEWDNWYLHHLLHYAPYVFQRPYYSKYRKIKELHKVYAYHMFTYQTKFFNGKATYFTDLEIQNFWGHDLKRIEELTPSDQRIPYNKLSRSRQNLVRQSFGEYVEEQYIEERLAGGMIISTPVVNLISPTNSPTNSPVKKIEKGKKIKKSDEGKIKREPKREPKREEL